jgi:hypothetical protein
MMVALLIDLASNAMQKEQAHICANVSVKNKIHAYKIRQETIKTSPN